MGSMRIVCYAIILIIINSCQSLQQKNDDLISGVWANSPGEVKDALAAGANANAATFMTSLDGAPAWTALMLASKNGYSEIVRVLIDAKADVNAATSRGNTALMIASGNGHPEVVKVLISAKADLNAKDLHDWTALITASYQGQTAVVTELIAAKAKLNEKDDQSKTALRWASGNKHIEIVKLLKAAGAR